MSAPAGRSNVSAPHRLRQVDLAVGHGMAVSLTESSNVTIERDGDSLQVTMVFG